MSSQQEQPRSNLGDPHKQPETTYLRRCPQNPNTCIALCAGGTSSCFSPPAEHLKTRQSATDVQNLRALQQRVTTETQLSA